MTSNHFLLPLFALIPQTVLAQLPIPNWKMVESLDTNKNDRITLEEFASDAAIFQAIDANQDQAITRAEVAEARKKTPPAPILNEEAPKLSALDPKTGKMVSLRARDRPYALIFGTHT